jgi:hypothetical protein
MEGAAMKALELVLFKRGEGISREQSSARWTR